MPTLCAKFFVKPQGKRRNLASSYSRYNSDKDHFQELQNQLLIGPLQKVKTRLNWTTGNIKEIFKLSDPVLGIVNAKTSLVAKFLATYLEELSGMNVNKFFQKII